MNLKSEGIDAENTLGEDGLLLVCRLFSEGLQEVIVFKDSVKDNSGQRYGDAGRRHEEDCRGSVGMLKMEDVDSRAKEIFRKEIFLHFRRDMQEAPKGEESIGIYFTVLCRHVTLIDVNGHNGYEINAFVCGLQNL